MHFGGAMFFTVEAMNEIWTMERRYRRGLAEISRHGEGGRPPPGGADVPASKGGQDAADRRPLDESYAPGQRVDLTGADPTMQVRRV